MERYLLGPELGRGGMGRVHLAWDPMLRRTVALKLLLGDDPEMHLRLLREARAQARLEHPHICRIHDLGEQDGRPYIAMQLVRGTSLSELRPELDCKEVAAILADVAGAVHAAHQSGLIHRDLKPANVLVENRDPRCAFVVDFGLARDLQAMDQTLSWAVMGTPAFMSPEQARGEALGPATDIYSLGATLYAMLTGHPPYEGSTLAGILTQQGQHGVRNVRRFDGKVPRDLETLTLKCLETDAPRRYPTALALEQELRRFLAGEPIQARPVSPLGRLARWARRKPTLAATAAAGLLATLLLSGWNLHTSRQAAIREAASQRFGMEIRDAEHLLRIERMMPIHDIRPAEARLRARMETIRREMEQLGGIARAPGLYAIGRGHLALRDYKLAIETLESSWRAGFQAPEVAYNLGMAHLGMFQTRVTLGARLTDAAAYDRATRDHLGPAMAWLEKGQGTAIENKDYGQAIIAMGQLKCDEADRLFQQALAKSPWLAEARLGQARNVMTRLNDRGSAASSNPTREEWLQAARAAEVFLAQAEAITPSDSDVHLDRSSLWAGHWAFDSSHGSRSAEPLKKANEYLGLARKVRPDDEALLGQAGHLALQTGFLKLSTGEDPAAEVAVLAREFAQRTGRNAWSSATAREIALSTRHHLWWIAAEADLRFGRDPRAALAEAARIRALRREADPHYGFTLMLEAKHRMDRGQDPEAELAEAERILRRAIQPRESRPASFFQYMILGEIQLMRAGWLRGQGRAAGAGLGEAIRHLEQAVQRDAGAAYPYYSLPRAHALAVRIAIARRQDPTAAVQAALAAGRRGVAINPRNAQIQQAAAEAHLADALARAARGEDPRPALASARRALTAADAVNPRDYRAFLLRAEAELEEARFEQRHGGGPGPCLRHCESALRRGKAIKGDEPGFRELFARMSKLKLAGTGRVHRPETSISPDAAPAGSGHPAAGDRR